MTTKRPLVELARAQDVLQERLARKDLRAFVQQAWSILEPETAFQDNWHIGLICEHLQAVTAGDIKRLVINLPPRHMKSLLTSVFWPAWEWLQRPSGRWIFCSYSQDLAARHSLDRRQVIRSPWYGALMGDTFQLADDQNAKHEFHNTRRGMMVATSVGGSVTGKGGDRIVIDDPHNPQHLDHEAQRDDAVTYFDRVLSTRLDNKRDGAIVLVMQRFHESDLTARCLDLGFTQLCLPAVADRPATIVAPRSRRQFTREVGDVLWPAREDQAVLDVQRRILGSAEFAAQYQQQPAPATGAIFKKDWWRYYDSLPQIDEYLMSWDMSFKDGPDNDYVVGLVAGRAGADIYLIDRVKGQWAFTDTCRAFTALCQRHPYAERKLVEDAANGPAIINSLGRTIPGIIARTPEGGKVARARAIQPRLEAGNLLLPNPHVTGVLREEREWVFDFLHHCTVFPRGAHDDDVDALTQLVVYWNTVEEEWYFV